MINYIWFFIIASGIVFGIITGNGQVISNGIIESSDSATKFIISLVGIMCFWCGVMKVAEKSGLTAKIAKLLKPILKKLFRESSKSEEAMGAIIMNLTANMLGLSNAATPFGIKAMEELNNINNKKGTASNDMALFLVMNACCIQLIPSTVISIRAAAGSSNPAIIILPAIVSTATACIVGIICCKILQRYF
ncbi:MAG: nucleoside recognition domain-containing protein [Clostridium perfringens]|nr:nucleoside recognition domain-containing protein [Clostridium perfringens]